VSAQGPEVEPALVRVGVAVVLRRGRAVLMGKRIGSHGAGSWSFPGGHLEAGETVIGCAARELREETGIDAGLASFRKLTYTNDIFRAEGKHYVTLYVECEAPEGMPEPEIREPNKCEGWRWFEEPPQPLFLPVANLLSDGFPIWKVGAS
jgi:8-oxo-dGTP diphosphatase